MSSVSCQPNTENNGTLPLRLQGFEAGNSNEGAILGLCYAFIFYRLYNTSPSTSATDAHSSSSISIGKAVGTYNRTMAWMAGFFVCCGLILYLIRRHQAELRFLQVVLLIVLTIIYLSELGGIFSGILVEFGSSAWPLFLFAMSVSLGLSFVCSSVGLFYVRCTQRHPRDGVLNQGVELQPHQNNAVAAMEPPRQNEGILKLVSNAINFINTTFGGSAS
ncbi:hypothetical protein HN51_067548 [Arachis hypogaea]|uniref:uncharacterized protein LOC107638111 isoform X2 n=1 Tax=Arachis ipaensis TaxID=130454 RepID=UPI0007AF4367|nr:uncharacterized protein LOC107638111 isoform X2 [Arachis ipaensis]QHO08988.1 uncharacterized protein DS421_14g477400 [Arachis hypogaea]